jgi:hypothetical protein
MPQKRQRRLKKTMRTNAKRKLRSTAKRDTKDSTNLNLRPTIKAIKWKLKLKVKGKVK